MAYVRVFLVLVMFGCSSTSYKIPSVNQKDVWKEYINQNAKRMEEFRKTVRIYKDRVRKISDVSWPILAASERFCDSDQADANFGFVFVSEKSWTKYEPYEQMILNEEFGTGKKLEGMVVTYVIDGSPAQKAGIQIGDRIIALNGKRIKNGKDFKRIAENGLLYISHGGGAYLLNKITPRVKDNPPTVKLKIERGNDVLVLSIRPRRMAKYHPIIVSSKKPNAFANGRDIFVTTGMMDFVKNDEELQFIIAHEVAHNIERHIDKQKSNSLVGSLAGYALDVLAYNMTRTNPNLSSAGNTIGHYIYRKDFELEADYLSMYILAIAKIPTDNISNFWRRLSDVSGTTGIYSITHPSNPERFVRSIATNKEIKEKQAVGLPLKPNK